MSDQFGLFPENATVVDESKRKVESIQTKPTWRKLPSIKGKRPPCGVCAAERWSGKRKDVAPVRHKRIAVNGEATEYCSEHADLEKARDGGDGRG